MFISILASFLLISKFIFQGDNEETFKWNLKRVFQMQCFALKEMHEASNCDLYKQAEPEYKIKYKAEMWMIND